MNYRRYLSIIFAILAVFTASAQDTIKIMQYNLLNYGTETSYCFESNNSLHGKDESIRLILEYVKPDIIAVNEFSKVQQLQDDFIRHNLNINGVGYWMSDDIINYANSSIINHIFYNSEKMRLKKHDYIKADPRDIDIYEFYFLTNDLAMGDTTKLIYVVAHLKAGYGTTNESIRNVTAQKIMNHLANNYQDHNVILSGDLNLYGSDESAYRNMTQSTAYGSATLYDPIENAGIGVWNNPTFAPYHTQSTHSDSNGCAASGGLDDRFDLFLMSQSVRFGSKGLRLVPNSYTAIGNDGYHYNKSINAGYNSAVDDAIADALYNVSDHLPISIQLTLRSQLGINENTQILTHKTLVTPNPAHDKATIHYLCENPQIVRIELLSTTGTVVLEQESYFSNDNNSLTINTSDLAAGFYLIRITEQNGQTDFAKIVIAK